MFQLIVLKKIKSEDQQRELKKDEVEKERILMEDAVGFHNFINFLSQSVSDSPFPVVKYDSTKHFP